MARESSSFQKFSIYFGIALFHALAIFLSLKLASINANSSPFWPPAGIAIGALFFFGLRYAPVILLSTISVLSLTGTPFLTACGLASANAIQALVSVIILRRLFARNLFDVYQEPFSLLIAAVIGGLVSATIGTLSLYFSGFVTLSGFRYAWVTWFGGDMVGILVFAPFMIALLEAITERKNTRSSDWIELSGYFLLMTVVSQLVFAHHWPEGIYWANCLLILLAHLRLGSLAGRSLLVLNCLAAIFYTRQGLTIFEFGSDNRNLLYLQAVMISFAVTAHFIEAIVKLHLSRLAVSIFTSGLVVIVVAVSFFALEEKAIKDRELKTLTERMHTNLIRAQETYVHLLTSGAGMMTTHTEPDYGKWKRYVSSIFLEKYFGAINGIGFVSRINKNDVAQFIEKIRKQGLTEFKVRELDKEFSSTFTAAYPITYVEPVDKNRPALGLDLGSEINRRAAADRSLKEKTVIATEPIQLVQDNAKRPGFLLFYPIFKGEGPSGTNEDQGNFIGWTYAPVIAEHFFGTALSSVVDSLDVRVQVAGSTIFGSESVDNDRVRNSRFFSKANYNLFGLKHEVTYYPKESFFFNNSSFPLGVGVILTFLLILMTTLVSNISLFNLRLVQLVEQKSRELDVERTKALHAAKLASLGEMAAGIAHEINNPLAMISGNVPLLMKFKDDDEKFKSKTESILKASKRIEKIVKGLKRFSRLSDGSIQQVEDLNRIIEEAVSLTDAKVKHYSVAMEVQFQEAKIVCDAVEIEQVLVILINNAVDAIKDNTNKWVKIECLSEGSSVVLRVHDSGAGITPEIEAKLFQPFFTTKAVGEGTGLGLSIAKGILDQHQAKFAVNRTFPHTCFEIRFTSA